MTNNPQTHGVTITPIIAKAKISNIDKKMLQNVILIIAI
jgi:hypothetical protein